MDRLLRGLIYWLVFLAIFTRPLSRLGIGAYEEWKPGRKRKILLVGYNGARNTGADVRTAAIARQIMEIYGGEVELTVMALDPEGLRPYFDPQVKLYGFTTNYLLPLYRACSINHAVVIAEGSVLKGTFADALTLYFCEACGIMKSQHKRCLAYGVEAGRMDDFLKRTAARLCSDTYFILRNTSSLEVVRSLGLTGHVGTDAAWCYQGALGREASRAWLERAGWDGKQRLLGLAVIDAFSWPVRASFFRYLTGKKQGRYDKWYYFSSSPERTKGQEEYLEAIAQVSGRFCREAGAFPVIIGMEKLDEAACRRLQEKLGLPCALLLSARENADVMTGVLRQMDLLVTSRYHAAVLGMGENLPFVFISMDERLDCLMEDLSLEKEYLLHTTEEDLEAHLETALHKAWERREEISQILFRKRQAYQQQLSQMGVFLRDYLEQDLSKEEIKNP